MFCYLDTSFTERKLNGVYEVSNSDWTHSLKTNGPFPLIPHTSRLILCDVGRDKKASNVSILNSLASFTFFTLVIHAKRVIVGEIIIGIY